MRYWFRPGDPASTSSPQAAAAAASAAAASAAAAAAAAALRLRLRLRADLCLASSAVVQVVLTRPFEGDFEEYLRSRTLIVYEIRFIMHRQTLSRVSDYHFINVKAKGGAVCSLHYVHYATAKAYPTPLS